MLESLEESAGLAKNVIGVEVRWDLSEDYVHFKLYDVVLWWLGLVVESVDQILCFQIKTMSF